MYLAHSYSGSGHEDKVAAHLRLVAARAADFARDLGAQEEAWATGLLHDLGKYGDGFQARLRGEVRGVDHWSAGAWYCLEQFRARGIAAALAIAGHHVGLGDGSAAGLKALALERLAKQHPGGATLSEGRLEVLLERMSADGLPAPTQLEETVLRSLSQNWVAAMSDVRMLYSTLVDADFVETEAHFAAKEGVAPSYRSAGPPLQAAEALNELLAYLQSLGASTEARAEVRQMRAELLDTCLGAAQEPPGVFTLTAPTGAGKTLSMLAFALQHAAHYGLRRVITVIPYLTIIEQTAREYRKALRARCMAGGPARYVLEDHSLAGLTEGDEQAAGIDEGAARLLAENWDAPLVVTTSVQCLESLFSNRPSRCRKLHRIAGSVLLFDEVQTLPPALAVPTVAALSHLAERYGCTVVFSTATQPAFEHLDREARKFCPSGWRPREIVPNKARLFRQARRVRVHWPQGEAHPVAWEGLAREIGASPQVLCIVNLKRHAWALLDALQALETAGLMHLSTSMCPAHRQRTLQGIEEALRQGSPCCLVSTQCVEAGVDLDFPVVYRAWGPLDAIAQAAGRCNRHGRIREGQVHVFSAIDERGSYPDQAYEQGAAVARALLARRGRGGGDIYDPDLFREYYQDLYDIRGLTEGKDTPLLEAIKTLNFAEVAKLYRLIRQDAINVLAPYDPASFRELEDTIYASGLTREWIQKARPYSVGLYRPRERDPLWNRLEPVPIAPKGGEYARDWFIWTGEYNPLRGLVPPSSLDCLIA